MNLQNNQMLIYFVDYVINSKIIEVPKTIATTSKYTLDSETNFNYVEDNEKERYINDVVAEVYDLFDETVVFIYDNQELIKDNIRNDIYSYVYHKMKFCDEKNI